MSLDDQLNRMCADGRLSVDDAEEVRRFSDFLVDAGSLDSPTASTAWRQHYPEDFARAVLEAEPETVSKLVRAAVRSRRHRYVDEISLHESIAETLTEAGLPFEREVRVAGGRIDFMVGRLGVEVKVKGSADALARQLAGYSADPSIGRLMAITTRSQHRAVVVAARGPGAPCSVPIEVVVLGALS